MNITNEWPMVKLGEVAEFINGFAFKPSDWGDEGRPIIRIQNLTDSSKPFNRTKREVNDKFLVQPGDLLVSWSATLGVFSWELSEEALVNQHIFKVIPSLSVDKSYLRHALKFAIDNLARFLHGATMKHINRGDFLNTEIPLPPLAEQQRIADILDFSQEQLGFLDIKKKNLVALRNGIIDQVLKLNERKTIPLKEIADIQSGITKGRKVRESETLTEIPYMAVSNVKDGHLDLQNVKTIPVTEKEIARFSLEAGDILLTEGGDPDKLGRGTVWNEEIETCLHQNHIFRVRLPEDTQFTPKVLMAMLATKQARAYFLRSAKQTTGIASINKTQLSAAPVPVLNEEEITEISRILDQIDKITEKLDRHLATSEELQKSLSARAFSGQL